MPVTLAQAAKALELLNQSLVESDLKTALAVGASLGLCALRQRRLDRGKGGGTNRDRDHAANMDTTQHAHYPRASCAISTA